MSKGEMNLGWWTVPLTEVRGSMYFEVITVSGFCSVPLQEQCVSLTHANVAMLPTPQYKLPLENQPPGFSFGHQITQRVCSVVGHQYPRGFASNNIY